MQLGIMQPYFFPYLGYFSLISATDQWIVFDPVQYIRHGWINRNRILHPSRKETKYIKVPLKKHSRGTLIKDIIIKQNNDWKLRIIRQLEHYKKVAPFYPEVLELVEASLNIETDSIVHQNIFALEKTCEYLGLPFRYSTFSEMELPIEPVEHPGQWALNIAKALKAQTYINPPGGKEIFKVKEFEDAGIHLKFLSNQLSPYPQFNENFIPGLSIVDVLMFNSKEETLQLINDYQLETKTDE